MDALVGIHRMKKPIRCPFSTPLAQAAMRSSRLNMCRRGWAAGVQLGFEFGDDERVVVGERFHFGDLRFFVGFVMAFQSSHEDSFFSDGAG